MASFILHSCYKSGTNATVELRDCPMIQTYADQLLKYANERNVYLKDAFTKAGVAESTFYRSVVGKHSLRLSIAEKVRDAIDELVAERTPAQ